MNALIHIRKTVLGVSQAEMAKIAGTSQATVSRWETGTLFPDLQQMHAIRDAAIGRGVQWSDELFFAAPTEGAAA